MEEFEIEINDKMVKVSVRRPKIKITKEYQNGIFKHSKMASVSKTLEEGNVLTDEEMVQVKSATDDITRLQHSILLKLCPTLKSEEDIDEMAAEDYQKIWSWVESKMGVKKSFLAKSPSP